MSDRINHRRLGRSQRPRRYRPALDRTEGFKHASQFSYPVDIDDEPTMQRQLEALLGESA